MTNTNTAPSADDLLSNGPPAFKFEKVGDTAKGVITKKGTSQVTDFKTKELQFYKDGNPIYQVVLTLRQDDGEEVRVFLKPAARAAVKDALQTAGAEKLEEGGRIALKFSGEEPSEPGLSPKKLFVAQYSPPAPVTAADDDLL